MAEAVLRPLDNTVNRNSKDSVFCDLFSDPKYVLELYAALHPEDDITQITDITLVTLDNQILRTQYNDLGFIIGNRLLILVEEQSSWSLNILIRILTYLGETYQRYIRNNKLDVYDTKPVQIPKPELYVVYPREHRNLPDEISLSRDIFGIENAEEVFLDVKIKIIFDSQQGDILNQYIVFCRMFDEQIKRYGRTEKAVTETIRLCRDQNVLKEYLIKKEVPTIMFGHFDKEYQLELMREKEREEGRVEGQISLIKKLMENMKITAQQAMDTLGISGAERQQYLSMLQEN